LVELWEVVVVADVVVELRRKGQQGYDTAVGILNRLLEPAGVHLGAAQCSVVVVAAAAAPVEAGWCWRWMLTWSGVEPCGHLSPLCE
jgi:hypothetical protein